MLMHPSSLSFTVTASEKPSLIPSLGWVSCEHSQSKPSLLFLNTHHLVFPGSLAIPSLHCELCKSRDRRAFFLVFSGCCYITKCQRLGGLSATKIYFSQFWKLGSPRSRNRQMWCLMRAYFLVHRWLSSCCVLTWQRGKAALWGLL